MTETKEDSDKDWAGFRPTAYFLQPARVSGLALTRPERTPAGEEMATPVTMGDVFEIVCSQTITEIGWPKKEKVPKGMFNGFLLTQVTTETGEYVFDGPLFNQHLLKVLLELRQDGINAFDATWFWYDSERGTDEPGEAYHFFVVYNDKIVRERVSFHKHFESGFDPSVFRVAAGSPPTWTNERESENAWIRFWYRKFYQETERGQLMVLREDEPELYHFPEGRSTPESVLAPVRDQLAKLESALGQLHRQMAETNRILLWAFAIVVGLLLGILLRHR